MDKLLYSQNFLKDKALVSRLVEQSSITKDDIVYEIGAGTGIITEQLTTKAGKVVAFEIDNNLFNKLSAKFAGRNNLVLRNNDFIEQSLPSNPYKVFSNIPFNITAQIIKKLTWTDNPSEEAYLIIQKEAAKKFVGKPLDFKNSQISILLRPWFDIKVIYNFQRTDFIPKPNVDTVLLRINKRETPLISHNNKRVYEDFIVYTFSQFKPNVTEGLENIFGLQNIKRLASQIGFSSSVKPSELNFEHWLHLFNEFLKIDRQKQKIVFGSFTKARKQDEKIEKINRTRVDKDWKSFRKN